MSFLTVSFAIFFFITVLVLSRISNLKVRNIVLLLANLVFYSMGDIRFAFLLIAEIAGCYFTALKISSEQEKGRRGRGLVIIFVTVLITLLAVSKYTVQPLGISFYTLMIISYVIDVYRGKMEAETDPVAVALYASFFPQIMSGPITKARDLMGQFKQKQIINKKGIYSGAQIFLTGALKKVLIADRLAVCSDAIYSNPSIYSGLSVFLGTVCYTIQLYCDFSGYTDMATGIATMLGFKLARNFNLPYIAKNPTETWKRWHMSLSSWLQEYVYITLGGNRKGKARQYINLILTMIVGGLWHGVAWTYVLWGLQCGIGLCAHKVYSGWKERWNIKTGRLYDAVCVLLTYLYFLMGTVIFRAGSVGDFIIIFKKIFTMAPGTGYYYVYLFIYLVLVGAAYGIACLKNRNQGFYVNLNLDMFKNRVLFLFVILTVIIYGYFGNNVFIYAQF